MYKLLYSLEQRSGWVRREVNHVFYNYLAGLDPTGVVTLLNYGYAYLDVKVQPLRLAEEDEPNRYPLQLYDCVASAVDLRGRDVLEVGSGRGGGASFVKRYLGARTMTGVDYSEKAVAFCQQHYRVDGLRFVHGDAENLPLEDGQFDAVINIESSHCYGVMARFLAEVRRVLRPGSHLLWADYRQAKRAGDLKADMAAAGFAVVSEEVISPNVLQAMRQQHKRSREQIDGHVPRVARRTFYHFAGLEGTYFYNEFASGELVYLRMALRKA